jgi:hypothetical protein
MRCVGRTKKSNFLKRCEVSVVSFPYIFCGQHIWQPFAVIVALIAVGAGVATITGYSLKDLWSSAQLTDSNSVKRSSVPQATIGERNLDHKSAEPVEEDRISVQLQGAVVCDDSETRFATIPSLAGPQKTVITTRWPVIISNNGLTTISLTAYAAVSRIHGRKRNIQTRFLDKEGLPTSLPIVVRAGESMKLFLVVPVHIIDSVYDLVRDVPAFSSSFTPEALDHYLEKKHGIDLYGNACRYATKTGGAGPNRIAMHVFQCNEDGTLSDKGMQADQLTVEFKTARGNYFSASALYYDPPGRSRSAPPIFLRQGTPATINFEVEPIDRLPRPEQLQEKTRK